MNLISVIKYIARHPLTADDKLNSFARFFKWQIGTRLIRYPVVYPFTNKAKMIIAKGMTGATGNYYCGLHEFSDMSFVLQFLRSDDLFIDIGANTGSYMLLSSAHIGARTIAIEPVPSTFSQLLQNIAINMLFERVKPLNIAIGSKVGKVKFTSTLDAVNHVALDDDRDKIDVEINSLDMILESESLPPRLLKIDVEGFEYEVIMGAANTLKEDRLKAIIVELNGSGSRYGYNEEEIHNTLVALQFAPYSYDPFNRTLLRQKTWGSHNTIYIRDEDFVQERLNSAPIFKILKKSL